MFYIWKRIKAKIQGFYNLKVRSKLLEFIIIVAIITGITISLGATLPVLGAIGISILLVSSTIAGWIGIGTVIEVWYAFMLLVYYRKCRKHVGHIFC